MKSSLTLEKFVQELVKNIPPEAKAFSQELIDESDRGVALICAEDLGLKLKEFLRARFASNAKGHLKKVVDPLFDVGGPLGPLSFQIKLAFSIGYVDEPLFSELDRIRDIRNKFAHSSSPLRFASPPVSVLVQKLRFGSDYSELLSKSVRSDKMQEMSKDLSDRWRFIGSYLHCEFAIKVLYGAATNPSTILSELDRIRGMYA